MGSAVVPPSGFSPLSAGLCLMLEYARDSPSHRYTRAHTRALTHAHAPLFADRARVAPKWQTPPRSLASILSRTDSPAVFSRALSPASPLGQGEHPAEVCRWPFHASLLKSATRGRGGPKEEEEEERPGGRPGGRARAHTEGRSERRAPPAAGRPPAAPCCAPWRTRAASCCPTPAACSRTPCPARPPSSTSNR